MQNSNNFLIPFSIVIAGGLVAFAVFFGLSSQDGVDKSADGPLITESGITCLPSNGAAGGDRQLWNNPGIHCTYADELGLDINEMVECLETGRHEERVLVSTREAQNNGGQGTPYFLINDVPVSGAQSFAVFEEVINGVLEDSMSETIDTTLDIVDWPTLGDSDAPILMIEYSDFACPFCKRFVEQTKPSIIREYIDTGLVQYVRKDFIAVGGQKAAEAAHCAGDQGAYWEYHYLLTERQ